MGDFVNQGVNGLKAIQKGSRYLGEAWYLVGNSFQRERKFVEAADAYDLDWRLLPSLSFIETTGGKAARNNNMFGWDSGRTKFTTAAAGIHAVGYNLANSDTYRGKKLESLLATYNPYPDYARKVKSVMRSIAPAE